MTQIKYCVNPKFVIFGTVLSFLIYFFLLKNSNFENNRYFELSKKSKALLLIIQKVQDCMLSDEYFQQNLTTVWPKLPEIADECSKPLLKKLNESYVSLPNNDEEKHFIYPISPKTASCNVVTLGIGGDVTSEEKLSNLMPQCTFLGVDYGSNNSKSAYEEILNGTYVQGLVGVENGTFTATVLEKGKYVLKTSSHFSFLYFLSTYFKKDLIDLLFMDIESAEFGLMQDMIENPELYPTICEMNVEFHDPYARKENVMEILRKMTKNGPYLVLKVESAHPYMRMFVINVFNEICLRKYLFKY